MSAEDIGLCLLKSDDAIGIRIKVVPGARQDRLAGILDDRLKISVSAPPEGGKANKAVCKFMSRILEIPLRDIAIVEGQTQPRKMIEVAGISLCACAEKLRQKIA